jgi:2-iminobutanoate/2-iminopropanoate deaminase
MTVRSREGDLQRRSFDISAMTFGGAPVPFGARVGQLFASSGIPGTDPHTGVMPDNDAQQVENLFANIKRGVEASGGSVAQILKCTFHVRDEDVRKHINLHWEAMFPDPANRPARHTLRLQSYPREYAVMAEFLAVVPSGETGKD